MQQGLQVSLTTSGISFEIPGPTVTPQTTAAAKPTRKGRGIVARPATSFVATASVTNLSRTPIEFSFANASDAATHLQFQVLNSAGVVVWTSTPPVLTTNSASMTTGATSTLGRKENWRRTVRVPLTDDSGAYLPAGLYRLQALVGDSPVSASSFFELKASAVANSTGIQGKVTTYDSIIDPLRTAAPTSGSSDSSSLISLPFAQVTVSEVREDGAQYDHPPFSTTTSTDENGNYKVITPPGRFQVSARPLVILNLNPTPFTPIVHTLTVVSGQLTTQNLSLYGPDPSTLTFQPIYNVNSVSTSLGIPILGSSRMVFTRARGHTSSTGWVHPRLVVRNGGALTADGILEYDFQAAPPDGVSAPVLMEVNAFAFATVPPSYKGSRVYSATNALVDPPGADTP